MASEQTRTKRSAASLRTPLIEWRNCEGTLTVGDDSRDVKCRVAVARNGLITVAFKDQRRSAANSRVSIYREAIGHTVPYHRLSVRAPNGDTLTTEHLVITHSGTKSTGRSTVFRLSAQARRLDVTKPHVFRITLAELSGESKDCVVNSACWPIFAIPLSIRQRSDR